MAVEQHATLSQRHPNIVFDDIRSLPIPFRFALCAKSFTCLNSTYNIMAKLLKSINRKQVLAWNSLLRSSVKLFLALFHYDTSTKILYDNGQCMTPIDLETIRSIRAIAIPNLDYWSNLYRSKRSQLRSTWLRDPKQIDVIVGCLFGIMNAVSYLFRLCSLPREATSPRSMIGSVPSERIRFPAMNHSTDLLTSMTFHLSAQLHQYIKNMAALSNRPCLSSHPD
jgi:hypothetical protein